MFSYSCHPPFNTTLNGFPDLRGFFGESNTLNNGHFGEELCIMTNLFDEFIKAKEDHIIDTYCIGDDCDDCEELAQGGVIRKIKKMYVDNIAEEIMHPDHE